MGDSAPARSGAAAFREALGDELGRVVAHADDGVLPSAAILTIAVATASAPATIVSATIMAPVIAALTATLRRDRFRALGGGTLRPLLRRALALGPRSTVAAASTAAAGGPILARGRGGF